MSTTTPTPPTRASRSLALALTTTLIALLALSTAGAATQQLDFNNVTIFPFGSQQNNGVDLVEGYSYNATTYGVCYGYDNFQAHRVALSGDQGVNWRIYDFFNGSGAPNDKHSCRLSHNGGGVGGEWLAFTTQVEAAFFKTTGFDKSAWDTYENFTHPDIKKADTKILTNGTYAIAYYFTSGNGDERPVIALSHDQGQTWNEQKVGTAVSTSNAIDFGSWNSSRMWIAYGDGDHTNILFSEDGGKTWTKVAQTRCSEDNRDPHGLNLKAQSNTFLTLAQVQDHSTQGTLQICLLTSNNEGKDWTEDGYTFSEESDWACRENSRPDMHYINSDNYFLACYGQKGGFDEERSWVLWKDDGSFTVEYLDQTQRGGDPTADDDADAGSTLPTVLDDPTLYTTITINQDTERMENQKKDAPPPGVVDQTEIFGNAGEVHVDWKTTEDIYVLDTQPDNTIWYGQSDDLSGFAEPNICGDEEASAFDTLNDVSDSSAVTGIHVSSPRTEDTFTVSYRCLAVDNNNIEIAAAFARSSGQAADLCNGERSWCDEDVIVGVDTSPNTLPLHDLDSREANELIGGVTAGTEQGSFSLTSDGDDAITANQHLPEASDFAVDHNLDADLRFCGVAPNSSIGIRCFNADGGEITNTTATNGNEIDVYNNELWINNGTELSRWERSGSSLVKLANNTVNLTTFHGLTKDGQYAIGTDLDRNNTFQETIVKIYASDTLKLIVESEPIGDSDLRGLDTDYSNNYAYATSSTTLYKIDLFNFTASEDGGDGVIGQQNPESGEEPQVDDGDDTTDGSGGTTDGSSITDLSEASSSLGIAESDFAVLMSTIAIFTFAGGAFIATASVTGQPSPMLAAIGGLAGAGLSVAYSWMPAWLLLLLVLILTATIVLTQTNGES
jgi:hypothetical protein